ncbi:trypsin-like peptidase domain-containing protein [Saccharothrix sp. AJ9571]|nr:trypsin-like peptidase domain-containing protein [Saccharothrix sp. AJ9571]
MSQQPNPQQDPSGAPRREDRLVPRPLERPPVDPAQASVFGRPRGVDGAFDRLYTPDARNGKAKQVTLAPPPPESLAEAFRRPPDTPGVVLQRPAGDQGGAGATEAEAPLWSKPADPWRDPNAGALLGGPAVAPEEPAKEDPEERPRGAMLSLPEVLFGRQVKPTALALLGVIALLIGAVGGLTGWWLSDRGDALTGELNIAEAEAGKERPPGSVAEVAQRVAPAVVSLEIRIGEGGGSGSGVVIDPQGYILTNDHVVSMAVKDQSAKITAVFINGTRSEAKVVGTDPKTDLAVVKVNVPDPVVVQVGKSADLAVGDSVLAVGSPLGLENTVTSGIVSALNRPIGMPGENGGPPSNYGAIQTDAPINPGNSGGALVDSTGALVGINTSILGGGEGQGGNIGIGFAIPIDQAIRISRSLIEQGSVKHADLGLNAASVAANTSEGAQVQNVAPGGPAAGAGIAEGDVITKVGDRIVRTATELTVVVREHNIGDVVPVQLSRQGRQLVVDVTLGSD